MNELRNEDLHSYFQAGHTGFWKQEYEEGKHPRLYTDEIMNSLIGATGDMTPEECYDFFAEHIHPEELECFADYIAELKVHEAEVIYRYIHPVTGNMYVRCTGRPVPAPDNMIRIVGYHQEVSDVMRFEPDKLLENRLLRQNQALKDERERQDYDYRKQKEQKEQLEEALAEQEAKNEIISAISNLYKEIVSIDLVEQTYVLVSGPDNKYIRKGQTGPLSRITELFLTKNVSPDYRDEVAKFIDFRTLAERLKDKMVITRELKGISEKWYAASFIVKKRDKAGNVTHILMAVNDINEQKEQELEYQEKLKEAVAEAESANLAKTDFLRRMSHDIRTPINGIRGMLEIANYYPEDLQKQRECRNKIWSATEHLLSLVNDVLDMNKLESGKFVVKNEPFSLIRVLDEVNTVSEAQAEDFGIRFLSKDTSKVEHDRLIGSAVYLKRILLNFTSNAIKYNRAGGQVVVTGSEISCDGETAWYEFLCEDNGIGMSEEFLKHAFEPFTQEETEGARTQYTGTGLGLAIAKQLVDLLHGTLEMQSKQGVGTKVIVRIPFAIDTSEQKPEEQKQSERKKLEGIRVMLVEDNELNAEIATFMLERHGMKVTWIQNGALAVEAFTEHPDGYDVIFMDVMMPVMNGLQATGLIRSLDGGKTIPIFAMTANAFTDDVQRSLDAGMNAHLTKPLQEKEILKTICNYISIPE